MFRNRILAALPPSEIARLEPDLTLVELVNGQILHEPKEPVSEVFFLERGLATVGTSASEYKKPVQVALIGSEAMTGLPTILGRDAIMFNTVAVQVPGRACRMSADILHGYLDSTPVLRKSLFKALEIFLAEIAQTAACHSQHAFPKRLANWLLLVSDRLNNVELPFTQESLASVLGVRRPSVSITLHNLAQAGLIEQSRCRIVIRDRIGLEAAACACHARLRAHEVCVVSRPTPMSCSTELPLEDVA